MQKTSVTFLPTQSATLPQNNTSFLIIPSAYYYYTNANNKIAAPNNVGTPYEQEASLIIWYTLKSNAMFPLETSYATARQDQIGMQGNHMPVSKLSRSMKGQLRQYPSSNDWIFDDRFQMILSQMKNSSLEELFNDFYRFPLNSSADAFAAARLLEQYIEDANETPLRKYFANRGITHLQNHNLNYYPIYYLFFLMTRYASYPLNDNQILLAQKRAESNPNSAERIFIDAIFDYQIYNMAEVLNIIQTITTEGAAVAGERFGTNHADWVRWADEYLKHVQSTAEAIPNLGAGTYVLAEKLQTWTDIQIEKLAQDLDLELPFRSEYPTRYAYISSIAGTIQYYKASQADTLRWIQMTSPEISEVGSV